MRDALLKQIDAAVESGMSRIVDGATLHAIGALLNLKYNVLLDADLLAPTAPNRAIKKNDTEL